MSEKRYLAFSVNENYYKAPASRLHVFVIGARNRETLIPVVSRHEGFLSGYLLSGGLKLLIEISYHDGYARYSFPV